jgi:hypothetical protein
MVGISVHEARLRQATEFESPINLRGHERAAGDADAHRSQETERSRGEEDGGQAAEEVGLAIPRMDTGAEPISAESEIPSLRVAGPAR